MSKRMARLILNCLSFDRASGDGGCRGDADGNELMKHVHASEHGVHQADHVARVYADDARHASADENEQGGGEHDGGHVSQLAAPKRQPSWSMLRQQEKM